MIDNEENFITIHVVDRKVYYSVSHWGMYEADFD